MRPLRVPSSDVEHVEEDNVKMGVEVCRGRGALGG